MFFEAKTHGVKYQINVWEQRLYWCIKIKQEGEKEVFYEIQKKDYQHLDSAISFIFKNSSYLVDVVGGQTTDYTVYARGSFRMIEIFNDEMLLHKSLKSKEILESKDALVSEMPGKIVKIFVKPHQKVQKNDPLLIIEAMKMENEIHASSQAEVKAIHVTAGESVEKGTLLISFEKT